MEKAMFSSATVEWPTPREFFDKCAEEFGPFDLDPCAPVNRPWEMAATHYTMHDDGLNRPWHGRVWCNPPYGRDTGAWLARLPVFAYQREGRVDVVGDS